MDFHKSLYRTERSEQSNGAMLMVGRQKYGKGVMLLCIGSRWWGLMNVSLEMSTKCIIYIFLTYVTGIVSLMSCEQGLHLSFDLVHMGISSSQSTTA